MSQQIPDTPAADPRDPQGRFAKGNLGGPGNPYARQCAAFRKAIHEAVSEADIRALAADLLVKARGGDLAAMKLLFAYAIGKPTEAPNPDRVELEDWKQLQEEVRYTGEDVEAAIQGLPVDLWTVPARVALDTNRTRLEAQLLEGLGYPEQAAELRLVKLGRPDDPLNNGANGPGSASRPKGPSPKANGARGHSEGSPTANGPSGAASHGAPKTNGTSGVMASDEGLLQAFRALYGGDK